MHLLPSSKEADLENNIVAALESVPLENMHWYGIEFNPSWLNSLVQVLHSFIQIYERDLNGKKAAWASKKY